MIKKLSAGLFALALVAVALAPAQAQDYLAVYGDTGSGLQRAINPLQGVPFDLVVQLKTDNTGNSCEFVIDELRQIFPSVLSVGTTKVNGTNLDLGDNSLGEYIMAYGTCLSAGVVEAVRISYLDIGGVLTNDIVIGVRGLQPGDTQPSSFLGEPGYVDCTNGKHPLALEPWDISATGVDPTKLVEVDSSDGVAVLNAAVTPNTELSVGAMKSRF